MFKLAFKNLIAKPLRTAVTVLAIAVAVAMIFAMLSFSPAVYDYIYSTQTATSGRSDIRISTSSSSDRITTVTQPLENLDGVEYICPSLTLYATIGGEYVQVRGFEKNKSKLLQNIDISIGNSSDLDNNTDNIVISEATAKKFGLTVGDKMELSLGGNKVPFYVCGIAKKSGYFLNDAPNLVLGRIEGISRLLSNIASSEICNEIYIKVADGASVDEIIDKISATEPYSSMLVSRTGGSYIQEQADSLSAPVVLAGVAVFALAVAVVVLLFMMSEGEKISLVSKYGVIGATKRQIAGIFLIESALLAAVGALVGSALAIGVFTGILKLTLSPNIVFTISAWRLFVAAIAGIASAIASSLIPIARAFKSTIRQNQIGAQKRSLATKIACPIFIVIAIISFVLEFTVPSATKAMSVVSLISLFAALGTGIAFILRLSAKGLGKVSSPSLKIAATDLKRDGRFSRSVTMLGVGMTVSMLLFMAWSMTQSVFGDYIADFSDLIFVTNVKSNVDTSQFETTDGVKYATKIVWKQGGLSGDGFDKTMNILGTKDALEIIDFGFVTPRDEVERVLKSGELKEDGAPIVFLDDALTVLYGVRVGDKLALTLDGQTKDVVVGGILKHRLFSGNYIVVAESALDAAFGVAPDTVVVRAEKDAEEVSNALRARFANVNYYVVPVLTAYKWDMESTSAVFDLIGTLAIVVAAFIFAITVFAAQVGRSVSEKGRCALLNAGASKRTLLKAEIAEHAAVAIVSYAISFLLSVPLTACLIHALRLFGLYFEFIYEAWVVAVVGAVMAAAYAFIPVALNFKKGYNIKKR